ncbi:hypothetical protein TNCV_4808821 [Trichonephila clavipes]|nr:hypothetical protein TNCV_4808821 [Trichonephila clavipes]
MPLEGVELRSHWSMKLVTGAYLNVFNPCKGNVEVDMPLRSHQGQYEQLPEFERRGIIGMMEAGGISWRVARQVGHSDLTARYWSQ